jgi:flagellum-specific peptidoglycan hydrolase FlgJ
MEIYKATFLQSAKIAAEQANHLFPEFAACEAALESAFGTSGLAKIDNNLFGMKQHKHPIYGTHILPTKEFLDGKWKVEKDAFVSYPSWRHCFSDRIVTLLRLAHAYPHYAAALAAVDGDTFVLEVSRTWSTDPHRADKVLAIHREWIPLPTSAPQEIPSDIPVNQ